MIKRKCFQGEQNRFVVQNAFMYFIRLSIRINENKELIVDKVQEVPAWYEFT